VSCAVARCVRSAGGCATMWARVGERRGARTRSRSGEEDVEKCKTRREGSKSGGKDGKYKMRSCSFCYFLGGLG